MKTPVGIFLDRESLTVARWSDPLVEALGQPVRSPAVEREWLPVLGPSCLVMLRRFDVDLLAGPITYRLAELGAALGIPGARRRGHPLPRSMCRLIDFGAARMCGDVLEVRSHLGRPPRRRPATAAEEAAAS